MNLTRFALHNLLRRPARTGLTVSAISLGTAAVVALTGIAWGFEASWQRANDLRGTDLILTRTSSENTMPSAFPAEVPQRTLASFAEVDSVTGLLSELLSVDEGGPPLFVFGWAQGSYLWDHLRLISGRWPASEADAVAVLGSVAAELLHKGVGDTVEIEGVHLPVVGLFESPASVENGAVLVTLREAQQITDKPGKVNVLNIRLRAGAAEPQLALVRQRVQATMPGFAAVRSSDLVRRNTVVRISKAMSDATICTGALVGALVVFNTMLMSVSERTQEIGILLALGWRRRTLVGLIVTEATLLTGLGGGAGIGLGVGLARALGHMDLMRGKIDAVFTPPFLAITTVLCILLGVIGGLYPAIKAARSNPAQALRHV